MQGILGFLGLLVLGACAAGYVWLNVVGALYWHRRLVPPLRRLSLRGRAWLAHRLRYEIKPVRVRSTWLLAGLQFGWTTLVLRQLSQPTTIWSQCLWLVSSLVILIFFQLCFLCQLRSIKEFLSFPATKLLSLALSSICLYVARGTAGETVSGLFHADPAPLSFTLAVATAMHATLLIGLPIALLGVAFEIMAFSVLQLRTRKKWPVAAVASGALVSCFMISRIAVLAGDSLASRVLLAEVAWEFDMVSPDHCELPASPQPIRSEYKVVFFATDWQKAMLLRHEPLKQERLLKDWRIDDLTGPEFVTIVDCYGGRR